MKTVINAFELTFLSVFILALGAAPAFLTFHMFISKYGLSKGGFVYAGVTLAGVTIAVLMVKYFVNLCKRLGM